MNEEEKKKGLTLDNPVVRNRFSAGGLKRALELKPAPLFTKQMAGRITVGNFEDDLKKVTEVDWIIEVVVESLGPKRELMKRVDAVRRPGTLVSSNTSLFRHLPGELLSEPPLLPRPGQLLF